MIRSGTGMVSKTQGFFAALRTTIATKLADWAWYFPTHDDEAVMDGAPERFWRLKKKRNPLCIGMFCF